MSDITKCSGVDCPVAFRCARYSQKPYRQKSYFTTPPFTIDKGLFKCEMFWGDAADLLFEQLKSIMSSKPIKKHDKVTKNKNSRKKARKT